MKKSRYGKERLSQFEVAIEKGEGELPKDAPPQTDPIEDFLESVITGYEWLDRPTDKDMHWLSMWKEHNRDRKETARALGVTPNAVKKWLYRLKLRYKRHCKR